MDLLNTDAVLLRSRRFVFQDLVFSNFASLSIKFILTLYSIYCHLSLPAPRRLIDFRYNAFVFSLHEKSCSWCYDIRYTRKFGLYPLLFVRLNISHSSCVSTAWSFGHSREQVSAFLESQFIFKTEETNGHRLIGINSVGVSK
jgi:hypothetical protein